MPTLQDFIQDLPADKQEAYKGLIANVVVINNREDASKHIAENQFLKSERDAIISRTTDNYALKFKEEKLPGLLADEVKKLNPPKDAKDQALADMQKELADMKRNALLKDRKAQAMQKLTEAGLPVDLADFAIDEDENIFASKIDRLSGLNAWKEAEIKKALSGAVGNQQTQKTGTENQADFSKMNQTDLMKFASSSPQALASVLAYQQKK